MDSYKIEWKRSAAKELKALPKNTVAKILKAVEQLPTNPYPFGVRESLSEPNILTEFAKALIASSTVSLPLLS